TKNELYRSFSRYDLNRVSNGESLHTTASGKSLILNASGRQYVLAVSPHEIRSQNYRAEDTGPAGVRNIERSRITTFKGSVIGESGSRVRLNLNEGKIEGYFEVSGERFFVEPARKYSEFASADELVVYRAEDSLVQNNFWCESDIPARIERGNAMLGSRGVESVQALRRIDLATEADFEYVNTLGGATQANNEILGILNMIEGTYEAELNLSIRVVFQHTWTTPDPFTGASADPILRSFQSYWNANYGGVSRNATHLFSGKSSVLSQGYAFVGVICNNPAFAYGLSGYISWAPGKYLITAHEIGHNLGANHADAAQSCSNTLMNTQLSGSTPITFCTFSRTEISSFVAGTGACLSLVGSPRFDFDGDGRSDVSVFRPSTGIWYINQSGAGFSAFQFGQNGDKSVSSDYDGDAKADAAVYRNGVWWRFKSATNSFDAVSFGFPTDVPAPADFDGDGKADVAVFRPSTGYWFWLASSNGAFGAVQFGLDGDIPAAGDFDGDQKADIAVFRPSSGVWYRLNSSNGAFFAFQFGLNGDKPLLGDFDGDAKMDIAVWRPSNGVWYITNSTNGAFNAVSFGLPSDIPAVGDFDGDAKSDVSVYRPSNGTWYRLNSGSGSFAVIPFGLNGDQPVPAYNIQ
ncbi:MAG: FG-GAP-like repeat-containing protein, partial [Blastocatellia bacterium]